MVAPNGARRTRNDHPAIPVTNAQIIETARACFAAGADGIHAHIRDDTERHLLDTAQYRDLVDGLHDAVPDMYVQVTSEAAGRYDATAQQDLIRKLVPEHVSVAMREMVRSEEDWPAARDFYHWADEASVSIQHIVYSTSELARFIAACDAGHIPQGLLSIQLVLGTYDGTEISTPDAIQSFVDLMTGSDYEFDWMLCAFGREETDCLVEAIRLGGKARIGFENSLWNRDGSVASDNTERVAELVRLNGAL